MKRFVKSLGLILTLDCEQSARLTSESLDRPLNRAERWAVKLHRLICAQSRRLDNQITLLDQYLGNLLQNAESQQSVRRLSPQAKQRIRQKLAEHQ
jgi:hypothetical protein